MIRRWLAISYLVALVISWVTMGPRKQPIDRDDHWQEVAIPGKDGHAAALRYRKFPGSNPDLAPLVLVHGSPMASSCFDPLLGVLPRARTILVPDLPGFGKSSAGFSDFSFPAHAAAMASLVEHENFATAHWVAYSQGGGPLLELSAKRPAAVKSLTLLSSIGVQEYELTGDYFLNHILHGAQLAALEVVRWGIPHFGLLDAGMINVRYAGNFYHGDMRPLRGILEKLTAPVLILQGESDGLVMPASAREHFRIVPHSELHWFRGGHMILISQAENVAAPLVKFLLEVDRGVAPGRADATSSRIAEAARPFDPAAVMSLVGPAFWLTMVGIALATLVSEDLACLAAGLLVARGLIPLPAGIAASFAGILFGDIGLYIVGRIGGVWCVERAPLRWFISARNVEFGRAFLLRRGAAAIFISRFIPGTRLPLYLAAGVVKMPALKMAGWFFLAAIVWVIPVVSLAAWFGQRATNWLLETGAAIFPAALLLLLLAWILLHLTADLATHRGRRILRAKWQRLVRWEFWPPYTFYPPIILAALAMGLRRRNLLAFTAANPAIPHGGIAGESKIEILNHLLASGNVAPFVSFPADSADKLASVKNWPDLSYPLVIKPDVGERGTGVAIVSDESQLSLEIAARDEATIVQKYIKGSEFGIFYIRHPNERTGHIFSITIKVMTAVAGDGIRTLEELILDDDRAVLSYRHFLKTHQDHLADIPAAGEIVVLANLGSHCRGALFLNGSHLITAELEAEIDRIARTFPGFHFGRFDLRCPDESSLRRGENLAIIELNGVTSEATHIYHPGTPIRAAYATLVSQWRNAYDIGIANAAAGAKVSTWREFIALLGNHFTRERS